MSVVTIKKTEFHQLYVLACDSWKKKFQDKFKDHMFSDTLDFEEKFLTEMYDACNDDQKKVFEKIFKSFVETFCSLSKIKTTSDLLKASGADKISESSFDFLDKTEKRKAYLNAVITRVSNFVNQGWKAKFDGVQRNWYPYNRTGSGLVFNGSVYDCNYFHGLVAFYKDQQTSDLVGRLMSEFYIEYASLL